MVTKKCCLKAIFFKKVKNKLSNTIKCFENRKRVLQFSRANGEWCKKKMSFLVENGCNQIKLHGLDYKEGGGETSKLNFSKNLTARASRVGTKTMRKSHIIQTSINTTYCRYMVFPSNDFTLRVPSLPSTENLKILCAPLVVVACCFLYAFRCRR